jgi:PAS domain S-box-containing protein
MSTPSAARAHLTGVETFFGDEEIIVSKADLSGRITYCNDVFMRVSGYSERELLGVPHSILRHPDMPRSVFKLLWDTIQAGEECFAYVVNRTKTGDHYWVLAHVTPSYDASGRMVGFHSNRRTPDRSAIDTLVPVYQQLLAVERAAISKKAAIEAGEQALQAFLGRSGMKYPEFVFSLSAA